MAIATTQTPPPQTAETKKVPKAAKNWQCQECGKRMTLKAAERVMYGADGCPKCGGADIDLAVETAQCDRELFGDPCGVCDQQVSK